MRDDSYLCGNCEHLRRVEDDVDPPQADYYCEAHGVELQWAGIDHHGRMTLLFRCLACMDASRDAAAKPFDTLTAWVSMPAEMQSLARNRWISEALSRYEGDDQDNCYVASVKLIDALNSIIAAAEQHQLPQAAAESIAETLAGAWSSITNAKVAKPDE